MAEYPKVIYVYQARSKLTGAVHRSYSDQETSYCEQKAYLRADTCTENKKLEELIKDIYDAFADPEVLECEYDVVRRDFLNDEIVPRLREVMK